ncbi:hypothetical protein CR513_29416, partial [Mucuna pruriens]
MEEEKITKVEVEEIIEEEGQVAIKLKDSSQNFILDIFYTPIHHGHYMSIDRNGKFIVKVKMTLNHLFTLKIRHEKFSYFKAKMLLKIKKQNGCNIKALRKEAKNTSLVQISLNNMEFNIN